MSEVYFLGIRFEYNNDVFVVLSNIKKYKYPSYISEDDFEIGYFNLVKSLHL